MGLRLSFFKTPKHRVFNYTPLYYDAKKERREELRGTADTNPEMMSETIITRHLRSRIHNGFQKAAYGNRKSAGNKKTSRIIILLSLAALLFALFYFTKMFELLMNSTVK